MDTYPIHESKDSEKVLENKNTQFFTEEFQKFHDNNRVHGIFYQDGEIVAEDIWQEIHSNILK